MSLRQPPILINPINKAKPRPPRNSYSTLRHRYNFGLMYQDIWEPQLLSPLYATKYNMEYSEAVAYIKAIMRYFVEQSERRSRDIIMELIGINQFKRDLGADNFFVIDYHFLMMKFTLNRGGSPTKALKINALIINVLLPCYKAVWCIQETLSIAKNVLKLVRIHIDLGDIANPEPVTSLLDIIIDEDLIEEVAIEDELLTFNELWKDDESALVIPEDITITPLMVLEYYIHKLNKLMVKLHYYKISINETIIKSINKDLKSLNSSLREIYNYEPQWLINVEEATTQSLTMKKKKPNSSYKKRKTKSI